jgi:hypothetical protein
MADAASMERAEEAMSGMSTSLQMGASLVAGVGK